MRLPVFDSRGVIHLLGLVIILALIGAVAAGVYLTQTQQFSFSRADTGQVPDADVCNTRLGWENKIGQSLLKNADFQGGYTNGVPNNWTKFVISGNPQFGEETGYVPFGKSFRISGDGPFSGGVYQTVEGLQKDKWYHVFYATAQKEGGTSVPSLREIGVDTNGGTNPSAVTNWGRRSSGGNPDNPGKQGGWKTMGARNNPLATFKATGPKATVFIKVSQLTAGNTSTWIISAYMGEDCGSGQTATQTGGTTTTGGTIPTQSFGGSGAPACDTTKVKMSIEPQNAKVGDTVTLNMTNTGGEGTTKISDTLAGLTDCQDNRGLAANFDQEGFWPKVSKYQTCKVSAVPFRWTHQWQNCAPNDQSCSTPSNQCSKYFDSASGEQAGIAPTNTQPAGGTSNTTPANVTAKDIQDKFGVTMTGFDNNHLRLAYAQFDKSKKFAEYVKGTVITVGDVSKMGMYGCKKVTVSQNIPDDQFNQVLVHELGHVIYFCTTDAQSMKTRHDQVWREEDGITPYGRRVSPACENPGGGPPRNAMSEDYAEMINYYLNPGAADKYRNNGCSDGSIPTPAKYPKHYQLAKEILG